MARPAATGKTLNWTDHINFPKPGIYQVYLGICYSSHDACQARGAPWARLSDNAMVVIDPADFTGTPFFLPLLSKYETATPTAATTATATPELPTVAPTIEPEPGQNVQCQLSGSTQICASVSDPNPSQNSTVTVFGRLITNGLGPAELAMSATWHYKTTTSSCDGTTNLGGLASCSQSIGQATIGYQVNVDVSINGYVATTWFTPQ